MKYYSEKLKKLFESEKDLILAEKEFDKKKLNSEKELKIKRQDAHDVEFAYSEYIKTVKEANKLISDASDKYIKLRNEFIKKYGSFHMSFRDRVSSDNMSFIDVLLDIIS